MISNVLKVCSKLNNLLMGFKIWCNAINNRIGPGSLAGVPERHGCDLLNHKLIRITVIWLNS